MHYLGLPVDIAGFSKTCLQERKLSSLLTEHALENMSARSNRFTGHIAGSQKNMLVTLAKKFELKNSDIFCPSRNDEQYDVRNLYGMLASSLRLRHTIGRSHEHLRYGDFTWHLWWNPV